MGFKTSSQKEIDAAIQDQHTPPFQYYLMREDKTDITLTSPVSKGDTVISVSSGHGFLSAQTPPHYMVIMENNLYIQVEVKSVSSDDITIYSPTSNSFTTGATVLRGIIDMDLDGTSPVDFVFNMRQGTVPIDIQSAHITIWNASAAGDDGKFGDLTALANGLRFIKENSIDQSLGTYRNNSDFREYGAEISYNDKSGGTGNYGVEVHFDIESRYGVVIRIDPRIPDIFKGSVQDNISTLDRMRTSIMGQYTLGE